MRSVGSTRARRARRDVIAGDEAMVAESAGWAVVLAAGSSRRFGRSKARLAWGPHDEPLLARAVRVALSAAHVQGVVVVVPGDDPSLGELVPAAAAPRVEVVINEDAGAGMASSIRLGVAHASALGSAFVVLLAVDQPLVEPAHLGALTHALVAGAPAAAAAYHGVLGIPAAFARASFQALCALDGDRGARRLLRDDPLPGLVSVPMPEAAIDVDTEESYRAARATSSR